MVSKNNLTIKRERYLMSRRPRFGIRKLSVGVASVLLGTVFFLGRADADEIQGSSQTPSTVSTMGNVMGPVNVASNASPSSSSVASTPSVSSSNSVASGFQNVTVPSSASNSVLASSTQNPVQSAVSANSLANSMPSYSSQTSESSMPNSAPMSVNEASPVSNSVSSAVSNTGIPPVSSVVPSENNVVVNSASAGPILRSTLNSNPGASVVNNNQPGQTSLNSMEKIPINTINLGQKQGTNQSTLKISWYDIGQRRTIAGTEVDGPLGSNLQEVRFKLPGGYAPVDESWQKTLPELNTGYLVLPIGKLGSAVFDTAREQLQQEKQQQKLAAVFGQSLMTNGYVDSVANRSYGVDVSSYQGTNMWGYAHSGAKFAIIKVSEGLNWASGTAAGQAASAKANGMMVMGYHFYHYAGSTGGAVQQANYAISKARYFGIPVHSYLALDWESEGGPNHGSTWENTQEALAWMQQVRNAGYLPMLYSGAAYMRSNFNLSQILSRFPGSLWVASYPTMGAWYSAPMQYFPSMDGIAIWQFTDNYKGMGVDGNINVLPLNFLNVQTAPAQVSVTIRFIDDNENGKVVSSLPAKNYKPGTKISYGDLGLPSGYTFAKGQSASSVITVGNNNMTFDIHMNHVIDPTIGSKTVTRHWEIDNPDGKVSSGDQSAKFSRVGSIDDATNKTTWGNWSGSQTLPSVNVPTITGYTASGTIPQITVDANSQDSSVKITYTKSAPVNSSVTDSKTITRTYEIDIPGGEKQTGTQTVTLNRVGLKNTSTGEVTWGDWSTGFFKPVSVPKVQGYHASTTIPLVDVNSNSRDSNIVVTYIPDSSTYPARDQLANRLIESAAGMLGDFTYGQDRPIQVAKNGDPDSITTLDDVNTSGRLDCSGFVWLAMKLAGENVVQAKTGPWYTKSLEEDARGPQNYLKQISDPSQLQPGDVIIVDTNDGKNNNGHMAIIDGYGVDYGLTNASSDSDILSSNLPIIEMGGTGDSVNQSTVKNAFYSLARAESKSVTIAAPVAMAPKAEFIVTVLDGDENNKQISSNQVSSLPSSYDSYVPTNYVLSGYKLNGETLTLTLRHKLQSVSDSHKVTRTIIVNVPGRKSQTGNQSITFARAGQKDLVTGTTKWQNWNPTSYTFDSVEVPTINGYTASGKVNKLTVMPTSSDSTVTINYTKNKPQQIVENHYASFTVHYVFSDGTHPIKDNVQDITFKRVGTKNPLTGKIKWKFWSEPGQPIELEGWEVVDSPEVKGYTPDKKSVYPPEETPDLQSSSVTVTYTKNPPITVSDFKDAVETIHYRYADGTQAAPDHVETLHLTRIGQRDAVTDKVTWGAWINQTFGAVDSPKITGYTPDVLVVSSQVTDADGDNIVKTVTYTKNAPSTTPVSDMKTVIETVHYVYENGTKAADDFTRVLTFRRLGTKNNDTGDITWGSWTDSQRFGYVKSPTISGYTPDIVQIDPIEVTHNSSDITRTVTYHKNQVTPPQSRFAVEVVDGDENNKVLSNQKVSQLPTSYDFYVPAEYTLSAYKLNGETLVLTLRHKLQAVSDSRQVTRCLEVDVPNQKPQTENQQVTFTRVGTKDLVTGKTKWNDWTPAKYLFGSVIVPYLSGYTPSGTIDGVIVTPDTPDSTVTINYTKNTQPTQATDQTQPTQNTGQSQVTQPTQVTDQPTSPVQTGFTITVLDGDENNKQLSSSHVDSLPSSYDSLIPANYQLSKYSLDNNTLTLTLAHKLQGVTDNKTVTRHIIINVPGQKSQSGDQSITFGRGGTKDLVTGQTKWGAWTPASYQFEKVDLPTLPGYRVSGTIDSMTVTPDSPDSTVTINYAKINQPTQLTQSTGQSQVTQPTQVTNQPTNPIQSGFTITILDGDENNKQLSSNHVDNLPSSYDSLIPANYDLSKYSLQDNTLILTLSHKLQGATDNKTVTRHIIINIPGQKAQSGDQSITFGRGGQKDLVTGQTKWGAWDPASYQFEKVDLPNLPGYTASGTIDSMNVTPDTPDSTVTITYTKNGQPTQVTGQTQPTQNTEQSQITQPTQVTGQTQPTQNTGQSQITQPTQVTNQPTNPPVETGFVITILDGDENNKQLSSNHVDSLPSSYDSLIPANYDLSKYSLQDNTLTLTLSHKIQAVTDNKTVTRHIIVEIPNQPAQKGDQSITFGRIGKKDLVTGATSWGAWNPASYQFDKVDIPVLPGYTASGSVDSIMVTPDTPDSTVTITYTKNGQPTQVTGQTQPTQNTGTSQVTQPTQVTGQTQPTQVTNQPTNPPITTGFVITILDGDENNKQLSSKAVDNLPSSYDSLIPANYDLSKYSLQNNTLTLTLRHEVQAVTDNKTVTRHIVIEIPGQPIQKGDQSVTFGRGGLKDLVTGKTSWSAWDPASYQFDKVDVPVLPGYTASGNIGSMNVTPDTPDSTVTITYTKAGQPTQLTQNTSTTTVTQPTQVTGQTQPTQMTGNSQVTQPTQVTGQTQPTQATGTTTVTQPTQVTGQTQPTQTTGTTTVTQPTQVTGQTQPTQTTGTSQVTQPTHVTGQTQPTQATGTTTVTQPTQVTGQTQPTQMTDNSQVTQPTQVTGQTQPTQATGTTTVTQPTQVTGQTQPTQATGTITVTQPTQVTGQTQPTQATGTTTVTQPTQVTGQTQPTQATDTTTVTQSTQVTSQTQPTQTTGITTVTQLTSNSGVSQVAQPTQLIQSVSQVSDIGQAVQESQATLGTQPVQLGTQLQSTVTNNQLDKSSRAVVGQSKQVASANTTGAQLGIGSNVSLSTAPQKLANGLISQTNGSSSVGQASFGVASQGGTSGVENGTGNQLLAGNSSLSQGNVGQGQAGQQTAGISSPSVVQASPTSLTSMPESIGGSSINIQGLPQTGTRQNTQAIVGLGILLGGTGLVLGLSRKKRRN